MNPLDELAKLTALFPEEPPLVAHAEHVPGATVPEPYQGLLVHEEHMTVTMEAYHDTSVDVHVLARSIVGDIYSREILLTRQGTGIPVQFGIVRFNLAYVTDVIRREILKGETPLGRILINHNVLRHIDLGAILKITAGPSLARYLQMPAGGITYGRLATIFCNKRPAVDLLEISSPLDAGVGG